MKRRIKTVAVLENETLIGNYLTLNCFQQAAPLDH